MHLGSKITHAKLHILGGSPLGEAWIAKDMRVLVEHRRSNSMQWQAESNKDRKYCYAIKPHIEYLVQFWSPIFRKDMGLKRVQ